MIHLLRITSDYHYHCRMKLQDLSELFKASLHEIYGTEEAQAIFLIAVNSVLKYDRGQYFLKKNELIDDKQIIKLKDILNQLKTGAPIQYILGETLFYGLPFKVNPSVLIPRPETEELIHWVIESSELSAITGASLRIIDIGTGSGCIAISLKKNLTAAAVTALDISEASIHTAISNASLNQVDIKFVKEDIRTYKTNSRFDVIVSNPPYITNTEQQEMHRNVLDHEPHLALFVSDEKPLEFYEAIADFAWLTLSDMGLLFFEINEHLGKETVEMLRSKSFTNIELRKDIQGKDRMIKCRKAII